MLLHGFDHSSELILQIPVSRNCEQCLEWHLPARNEGSVLHAKHTELAGIHAYNLEAQIKDKNRASP